MELHLGGVQRDRDQNWNRTGGLVNPNSGLTGATATSPLKPRHRSGRVSDVTPFSGELSAVRECRVDAKTGASLAKTSTDNLKIK